MSAATSSKPSPICHARWKHARHVQLRPRRRQWLLLLEELWNQEQEPRTSWSRTSTPSASCAWSSRPRQHLQAVENEFLKLHNPDIHLTDVMEDPRDGSLLLIDTGGWFRIGCPEQPDGEEPSGSADGKMPPLLVIDAIKKLKTSHFDAKLQAIANDAKQPQSLRLKALDAMSSRKITGETFTMVFDVLTKPESSAAAKIQAAEMMAHSGHTKEERMLLAKAFATVGPIELKSLLALIRPCKEEDILRAMAVELAKNPALISQQESIYRSALADKPTDIFEKIIHPAYAKAYEAIDAKKRTLGPLADKVIASGDAKAGKVVFESGKGDLHRLPSDR
jgi:hypothetical protein